MPEIILLIFKGFSSGRFLAHAQISHYFLWRPAKTPLFNRASVPPSQARSAIAHLSLGVSALYDNFTLSPESANILHTERR
jgi:hypothetical protein